MRIFPTVVRKIIQAAAVGAANFRKDHDLAFGASTVADFTALASSEAALSQVTVADLLSETGVTVGVEQLVSGTVVPTTDAALAATAVADMTNLRDVVAASSLTQFSVDFSRTAGANSVAETAVGGRTDWANDSNATGVVDTTTATIAGSAVGARGGQLEFGYANFTGKDDLNVDSVTLRFYVSQSGTVLNNGDLQLKWRKSSGDSWTVLETITGNVSSLTTPRDFVVTGSYTSPVPSDLDGIETAVSFAASIAELQSAACDAVELVALGSLVEAL